MRDQYNRCERCSHFAPKTSPRKCPTCAEEEQSLRSATDKTKIPLTGKRGVGRFAIVDDEVYDSLIRYRWCFGKDGYAERKRRKADGPGSDTIYLHREIMGTTSDGLSWDHANRDRLDCRKANLRLATRRDQTINRANRKNTTGFRGVVKVGRKFQAQIKVSRNYHYLGLFTLPEEAAHVYDQAALVMHGAFAILNFPAKSEPRP